MPTYRYECLGCRHSTSIVQKILEMSSVVACEECGAPVRKKFEAPAALLGRGRKARLEAEPPTPPVNAAGYSVLINGGSALFRDNYVVGSPGSFLAANGAKVKVENLIHRPDSTGFE